jgi:uncharacterized protein (TIGR03086 family)
MDIKMFERALEHTGEVVTGTKPEQFDDPTPCTEWSVRDLLNHIIGEYISFAAGAEGRKVEMSDGTDHVTEDHVGAYERAARYVLAAVKEPGALEKKFTLPSGDTPGSLVLGLVITDTVVHGWDLAKATGQEIKIDEDAAESAYQMTSEMMAPKGQYPRGESFGDPVEVSDDASPSDKLLAYLGRKP